MIKLQQTSKKRKSQKQFVSTLLPISPWRERLLEPIPLRRNSHNFAQLRIQLVTILRVKPSNLLTNPGELSISENLFDTILS